jgi:hypothetical protein
MRRRSVVKLDDTEYTVKELTVKEIIELFSSSQFDGGGSTSSNAPKKGLGKFLIDPELFGIGFFFKNLLTLTIAEPVKVEDLMKYAPSELNQLYEAFREVNSHFFDLAQTLKLGETVRKMVEGLSRDFSLLAADLSKQVIKESSITDIPSSSEPSTPI